MTDKQIIIDGCEFQSDCIEYKDISYLKIMPICAIHELSIACHDKVNKCKYYKLYKQLKAKEQECEELKMKNSILEDEYKILEDNWDSRTRDFEDVIDRYKQTLTEIKGICRFNFTMTTTNLLAKTILQKISECEVENEN